MIRISLLALTLLITPLVFAQEEEADPSNPFDLSSSEQKIRELGVPKKSDIDALGEKAGKLFNDGNCEAALPLLREFAHKTNWLANLIVNGLEPFYGASYDDRKGYGGVRELVVYETLGNNYKKKRNIAIAMQGECFLKQGKPEDALPLLVRALDLLDIDEKEWWDRTRGNLYSLIEVE